MITLSEFNQLDDNQKFTALLDGLYLEMRMEDGLRVQLHSLYDFYAEVYYDETENQLIKVTGFNFNSNEILAKYIKL